MVHKLSTFIINNVNLAVLRMTMDFNITIPKVEVEGFHRTRALVFDRLPITLVGNGGYDMILNGIKVFFGGC